MKNKRLVLLLVGVGLIIAVIFFMLRLLGNDNNLNNNGGNGNNGTEKTLLDIIKEEPGELIETQTEKKVEYNQMMIDSSAFKYLVKIGKVATTCVDGNEFTDDQRLAFASSYAWGEEYEELEKNAKTLNAEEPSYIKFEYLNEISKSFFGKEILRENISANIDGEYVEISLPTSVPENLYKFKEIKYNATSDVYSIYFDEIDPEIDNFDEILKTDKIVYNSDVIMKTYRLLYKKVDNENVILGLHQIL